MQVVCRNSLRSSSGLTLCFPSCSFICAKAHKIDWKEYVDVDDKRKVGSIKLALSEVLAENNDVQKLFAPLNFQMPDGCAKKM